MQTAGWRLNFLLGGLCFGLWLSALNAHAGDNWVEQRAQLTSYQQTLSESQATFRQQFQVLRNSRLFHQVLLEQKAGLPDFTPQDLSDTLAQLRLDFFALQRQAHDLRLPPPEREQRARQADQLAQQLEQVIALDSAQTALLNSLAEFRAQLDEHLLWTPSNPTTNLDWWHQLPNHLGQQLRTLRQASDGPWLYFGMNLPGYLLLAGLILLISQQPRLQRQLSQTLDHYHQQHFTQRSLWGLPQALGLTGLRVLPPSLAVLLLGWFLAPMAADQPDENGANLGTVLMSLAVAGFILSYLRALLRPQGIAERGLAWPVQKVNALRRFVQALTWILLPATAILALAAQQGEGLGEDIIGQLTVFTVGVALLLILWRLLHALRANSEPTLSQKLLGLILLILPFSLILLTAQGYYYSTLKLSLYYLITFYLISAWVITSATLHRTLELAGKQLGYRQQQLAKSLQASESGDLESQDATALPDWDTLDIQTDQALEQSARLVRLVLFAFFSLTLYLVWSDALAALHYLDNLVLWDRPDDALALPLSVGALFWAILLIVVTWLLARNLPGLLEVLVLSRMTLQPGSAYAITSITNYLIVGGGAIAVLATLGVSWDKLQWLAAGLTVGLGFGLQEIFANFISGLILLFERPIRVGDIITLNGLSGRISKIRIRSTIITDFDRRDIVVPNRSFITGQFVNWSLSNTVTRVVIKVGVAYGSDLDKTRDILLQAAQDNPRVMDDPAPQVLFLNFGTSTLDQELRIHVRELSDRNPAIDEINRQVDRQFKEAGIEIAFQQVDIHLRNGEGLEQIIEHLPGKSPTG